MASPMSLREAWKIAFGREPSDGVRWEQARDLMYAAVEAHEARTAALEAWARYVPMHEAANLDQFEFEMYRRLRALERGEGTQ